MSVSDSIFLCIATASVAEEDKVRRSGTPQREMSTPRYMYTLLFYFDIHHSTLVLFSFFKSREQCWCGTCSADVGATCCALVLAEEFMNAPMHLIGQNNIATSEGYVQM